MLVVIKYIVIIILILLEIFVQYFGALQDVYLFASHPENFWLPTRGCSVLLVAFQTMKIMQIYKRRAAVCLFMYMVILVYWSLLSLATNG